MPVKEAIVSASDVVLNSLAVMLSLTSAGFAAYTIFWTSPLNPSITTTPVTEYLAAASDSAADPITTGSTTRIDSSANVQKWNTAPAQISRYEIQVTNDTSASIKLYHDQKIEEFAFNVGDNLPGLGKVLSIDNLNGNWYIQTNRGRLASAGVIIN
jgi:hypothetical protein